MSGYFGIAPTPPRVWELWNALPARLDTATMQTILGGSGRVNIATDEMEQEGAESTVWGRAVVVPVSRFFGEPEEEPGRRRLTPFLIRTEVHVPRGLAYEPAITLEAAQNEAFARLHGWAPTGFTHLRVVGQIWRHTVPQSLPLWDQSAGGLWFLSAEYRAYVAPA